MFVSTSVEYLCWYVQYSITRIFTEFKYGGVPDVFEMYLFGIWLYTSPWGGNKGVNTPLHKWMYFVLKRSPSFIQL